MKFNTVNSVVFVIQSITYLKMLEIIEQHSIIILRTNLYMLSTLLASSSVIEFHIDCLSIRTQFDAIDARVRRSQVRIL